MAKANASDNCRELQHKKASQGTHPSLPQVYMRLCEREKQVVFYSSLGLPYKEIAKNLQVSHRSIKTCFLAAKQQGWSKALARELREAVVSSDNMRQAMTNFPFLLARKMY